MPALQTAWRWASSALRRRRQQPWEMAWDSVLQETYHWQEGNVVATRHPAPGEDGSRNPACPICSPTPGTPSRTGTSAKEDLRSG